MPVHYGHINPRAPWKDMQGVQPLHDPDAPKTPKQTPKKCGNPLWSDSERVELLVMYEAGVPIGDIALALDRTESAVRQQAKSLAAVRPPRIGVDDVVVKVKKWAPWTAEEDGRLKKRK